MKAKLICYTLKNVNHQTRSKFKREFFGYQDKSNKGKYKYDRKGILSHLPHSRPIRSIVIVKAKDESRIVNLLKKYNADTRVYNVTINKNELKIP